MGKGSLLWAKLARHLNGFMGRASCLPGHPLLRDVRDRESLKFRANNQEITADRDRMPTTELQKNRAKRYIWGTFRVLEVLIGEKKKGGRREGRRTQRRRKPRNRGNKVLYTNMRNSSAKTDEPEYLAVKEGFDKRGTS